MTRGNVYGMKFQKVMQTYAKFSKNGKCGQVDVDKICRLKIIPVDKTQSWPA
jgi:hypothetical protein